MTVLKKVGNCGFEGKLYLEKCQGKKRQKLLSKDQGVATH